MVEEKVTGQIITPFDGYLTEEEIQSKATEIKAKHPRFASVIKGISNLDLKENVKANIGAEVLQKLLKLHSLNLVKDVVEEVK